MRPFFDLLSKGSGYSRTGRISISESFNKFIYTPEIVIPFNKALFRIFDFVKEFEDHYLYIISSERFIKKHFLQAKYDNSAFFFTRKGTLEKFIEILSKKTEVFLHKNVLPIIPFNIPTTVLNKQFAENEIKHYLTEVEKILKSFPDVNFGLTIKLFDYSELIDHYLQIIKEYSQIKILNLEDLFDNLSNFRSILKTIFKIKQELDNNLLLMASGRIIPHIYPLLVYLGIDLIDSYYLLYLSSEGFYDSIEKLLPAYKIRDLPCSCVICRGKLKKIIQKEHTSEKVNLLCMHNLLNAKSYMNKIKEYLRHEDFRAFVEKTGLDNTYTISMLRILDKDYSSILKKETPILQENVNVDCLGASSYHRPDFDTFRERIIERFEPEPWTKLIIIFPCSATKPYSESKSHGRFLEILRGFPDFPSFQEIILTSPLGAIPRQLENVYPASCYDISVIGAWDDEEISIVSDHLASVIKKYDSSIPIITYLEGAYNKIISNALDSIGRSYFPIEIHDSTTSKESLNLLRDRITQKKDEYVPEIDQKDIDKYSKTWVRKFIKILDFQFGIGTGLKIFPNGIKYQFNKAKTAISLFNTNDQSLLATYKLSSGQVFLTIQGAEQLKPFESQSNIIVFDAEKIQGTNIFRPGIKEYDLSLLPGDIAIVLNNIKSRVIGMAQMIVSTNFIKNSQTGKIAELYERL